MTQKTAGYAEVDMNIYNIDFEKSLEEWSADITTETLRQAAGIYLGAKSSKEYLVDTLVVELPRRKDSGLGLELLELAGGREDGVGITVVSGIVDGGPADGSGIIAGDSLSQVTVLHKGAVKGRVDLECKDWDNTVSALGSLPQCASESEVWRVTVKRLRRKPTITLNLEYPPDSGQAPETITLFSGENLRRAMLIRGVKLNDALSKRFDSGGSGNCGADGTCATCVIDIRKGADLLSPPSTQEKGMLKPRPHWRLGCKAIVGYGMKEGELSIRINPRQFKE